MHTFFSDIPAIHHISQVTDQQHYYDVPQDWLIALTDVRGSTAAIAQGKYRDVNACAASCIAAMLNATEGKDIPYVFGGDGATMLVPPEYENAAQQALLATRDMARDGFGLHLRIGIVPVKDVIEQGYPIRAARLWVSDNFQQAIFSGGGITHAERMVKDPQTAGRYAVPELDHYEADFHGFECRWNEIPTTHEETLSLLVNALEGDIDRHNEIYHGVLREIERIYGDNKHRHPISLKNLRLAMNPNKLKIEATVRHNDISLRVRLKMLWGSIKAWIAMRLKIGQWPYYKQFLVESTDNEKFDDALRMIISGTKAQRENLRTYLDIERMKGRLVYGMHTSDHTLVTCIVFDYFGRQVHFVDGAKGGYTYAAKEMKAQLESRSKATMEMVIQTVPEMSSDES